LFKVLDRPILEDEENVLIELRSQLELNGISMFKTINKTTHHLQFNCPFHNNGQELKPSCGITTVDIKQGDKLVKAGTVHCFACGVTSDLTEMISYCFGYNDNGVFGIEWLRKNFLTVEYEDRPELKLNLSRDSNKEKPEIEYVSEEELDKYRYFHPYMYQRKLTDEIIEMFDVGYDDCYKLKNKSGGESHLRCITFPIRDITGKTLWIARRCVDTKFFHYPSGVVKPVYGIYELSKVNPYPKEVIICESIFNCLTCWVYGKYAVALNGTGNDLQYKQLRELPVRKYILGLDPDKAGYNGRRKLRKALGKSKIITEYEIPVGKDINDLTKEEFDALQELV
jgi:DNA primase